MNSGDRPCVFPVKRCIHLVEIWIFIEEFDEAFVSERYSRCQRHESESLIKHKKPPLAICSLFFSQSCARAYISQVRDFKGTSLKADRHVILLY